MNRARIHRFWRISSLLREIPPAAATRPAAGGFSLAPRTASRIGGPGKFSVGFALAWLLLSLALTLNAQSLTAQPLPQPPHLEAKEKKELLDRYSKQLDVELGLLTALDQLDRDSTEMDNKIIKLAVERAQATDALVASEEATSGSVMLKAERIFPSSNGFSHVSLCSSLP